MGYGSDVCTGGTATASREYTTYVIANAFDDNPATFWDCYPAVCPEWAKYDLGAGVTKTAAQYTITSPVSAGYPSAWTFEGSNDDSNWTTIDTQTAQSFTAGVKVSYNAFSNSTAYRYYRWNISAGNNDDMTVTEFEIMESDGTQTIVGVAFSAVDTFVAGSVFPIFGAALSSVDTFVAGNFGIEINGVALSSVDTFVAGTLKYIIPGAFVSSIDEFVAGTILGNSLNKRTVFPNLSGRHISIKVSSTDSNGGLSVLYSRFKLHKSTDRSRVNINKCPLPRMDGTHLSIKVSHSTEADFLSMYMSTLIDGFRD
jgi:hypothetical protein